MLTGNQAVSNGLFCVIYLIYVTPMIVFDLTFLKDNSHHAGFLLLLCYDVSIQTHALITVNRFCAVFLPMVYKSLFNSKCTNLIMLLSFLISLIQLTIFFQILPCRIYYNEQELGYYYTDLPICWDYSLYLDMGKLMTICTFNVVVDTITIWKVRRIRSGHGVTKFQKKEIDFLKQSFGQALYLFICIPAYYIIPLFTSSKIVLFMIGMIFWATIHMFDGVLTLYFNMEIRKSLIKKCKTSGNNSVLQMGVSIVGIVCNGLIGFVILRNGSSNHSFSILTGNQAILNGLFSITYLIYVAPLMVFDITFMKDNSEHSGFLLLLFHNAAAHNHVLITINRFCAVFWPLIYKTMCTCKHTLIVIFISFSIAFAQMITLFQILPCRLYYNEEIFGYSYTELPLCQGYLWYVDVGKQMGICVFNLVVDTITIWKVRKIRSAQGVTKIQKKEIDFLKQVHYSNPNYGWKGKAIKFHASAAGNFGRSLDASAVHKIPTVFFLNERQQNVF
ncbi:hypothetical protein CRE_11230 [Caenorhabditis remanei]|uniref:7TM GPCR serpentine receptor class x (Srx) domain-containing protein n=1 Tax=Caenorhabditis remanei TaxID=31234 RepID=E3MQ36_CAERE|nr:hypothetical protein CRE_11230 [Caenorhabditis remanei]